MAIRATPPLTETSRKSGLALGKLAPTRTTWTRPLTEILAAPVTASVRVGWWMVTLAAVLPLVAVGVFDAEDELLPPLWGRPWVRSTTCWANGSLPVKWLKE